MKKSSAIAGAAGTAAALTGLVAAVLLPIGGLIGGAIAVHGAVAGSMGGLATLALTAAGGLGGLVLGRIAAPIAAIAAVGVGAVVGGVTKVAGSLVEKTFGLFKGKNKTPSSRNEGRAAMVGMDDKAQSGFAKSFNGFSLKSLFTQAQTQDAKRTEKLVLAPTPAQQAKLRGFTNRR